MDRVKSMSIWKNTAVGHLLMFRNYATNFTNFGGSGEGGGGVKLFACLFVSPYGQGCGCVFGGLQQ